MSGTLRISICDPNQSTRESLKKFLIGMDKVWLEADCSRYDFFAEIVEKTTPDVALIDLDSDDSTALDLITSITRKFPSCSIIAVSARSDWSARSIEFLRARVVPERLRSRVPSSRLPARRGALARRRWRSIWPAPLPNRRKIVWFWSIWTWRSAMPMCSSI